MRPATPSFCEGGKDEARKKNVRQKKKFLAFEDSIIDEGIYFQIIDNGEELYHPWGKWGESFYVTGKDKTEIKRIWGFTVIMYLIVFIIFKTYGSSSSFFLLPMLMNVIFIINVGIIFVKCKNLKPYLLKNKLDFPQKILKFSRDHVALALLQLIIVFIGMVYQPENTLLWGVGIFTAIFYSVFFFLLQIRKGYIFQKNPPA